MKQPSQTHEEICFYAQGKLIFLLKNSLFILFLRLHILAVITSGYRGISHSLADRVEHRLDLLLQLSPLQIDQRAYQHGQHCREKTKHHRCPPSIGSEQLWGTVLRLMEIVTHIS